MASLLRHEREQLLHRRGASNQHLLCSVTGINGEFKIGMKNFTVMSEAEDGNILKVEAPTNPPATPESPEAPTATPEA